MTLSQRIGITLAAGCVTILSACSEAPQDAEGEALFVEGETAGSGTPLTGKFVHLSDIHFSPYYNDKHLIVQNLPVEEWKQHFDASDKPTLDRKYDSNFALMMSALSEAAAQEHDFVLYTGDYLAHDFREHAEAKTWVRHPRTSKPVDDPVEFAAKTVEFVNLMIEESFPDTPIVAALGNNDAGCGDYNLRVGGEFLKDLGPDMPTLTESEAKDFVNSGFYSVTHPTVPDTDFLVLGTFWSHSFPDTGRGCGNMPDDPGTAQKNWLTKTLSPADEDAAKRNAILLMHIPPGIDGYSGGKQWHDRFESAFETTVPRATRPIVGAYAGHTHMDEMRVLSNEGGAYLAVRVAPSVTTYNGNLPSFTVANYDTSTGAMTDYEVHSYRPDSSGGNSWQSEYRFSQAYKLNGFTPANIGTIAARIQDNDDTSGARAAYLQYYSAKDRQSGGSNWKQIICATSHTDAQKFWDCVGDVHR
ncbi:metallophosphoesterase [Erythrobacter sp. F6033]|uniref:metallophosphoesterase n=1 Tax=Erythrobacter sp. F6033 TaxID=2926401 RepID=UPI001FF20684|nr:metallophosphoesterase [Erythrobacter sp. F6033]MCK0127850.1 metallophosphoesterase [Erythrobacter sp. F6033]